MIRLGIRGADECVEVNHRACVRGDLGRFRGVCVRGILR